ncbi:MAG: hypothetical protein R3C97_19420 [Geminicoccaceae bacterium]
MQLLGYYILKTRVVHPAPGESNRAALDRRDHEIAAWARANDERREQSIVEAWAEHRRYKGLPEPRNLSREESEALTKHAEIKAWIEKRKEDVLRKLRQLGIDPATIIHRSALDWLIRRHLEGFEILYSDLMASLLFGDRFLAVWPRDGPPG